MADLAIIGGTGLRALNGLELTRRIVRHTPFGEPSGPIAIGEMFGSELVFLARHGQQHTIPPHRINYRANIWALKDLGVKHVIAIAAVGGITEDMAPGNIAITDQIIDYTWSRDHTFFEEGLSEVVHIEFTNPYSETLRQNLLSSAKKASVNVLPYGTYAATQGPRLESAAEINRLERDGCHVVGMTGMPEAALARELELNYATCAVVANWAAGRSNSPITMEEIERSLETGMVNVKVLLEQAISKLRP